MKNFELIADCASVDFEDISLCDTKVHGKDIGIAIKLSAYITQDEFKKFVENLDGLQGDQFFKIKFEKLEKEEKEPEVQNFGMGIEGPIIEEKPLGNPDLGYGGERLCKK